jgi:hypothetical protein
LGLHLLASLIVGRVEVPDQVVVGIKPTAAHWNRVVYKLIEAAQSTWRAMNADLLGRPGPWRREIRERQARRALRRTGR